MKKTLGEVKNEIISLGFEEASVYADNPDIFIESINRAMLLITTTVRPIVKRYKITQNPIPNLLSDPHLKFDLVQHLSDDIPYTAENPKAYYFECDGNGTAEITDQTGAVIETVTMTSSNGFVVYKGFITATTATITFKGNYAYNIRNVAMYGVTYSNTLAGIPPYTNYNRYNIAELTAEDGLERFIGFSYDKPVQQGNYADGKRYQKVSDYKTEERKILVLDYFETGQFEIFYNAAPLKITEDTLDDYELELDYEVTPLVPLLSAYYIWLDDEERKAIAYWNQYDDLKDQIIGSESKPTQSLQIENTTGWWN